MDAAGLCECLIVPCSLAAYVCRRAFRLLRYSPPPADGLGSNNIMCRLRPQRQVIKPTLSCDPGAPPEESNPHQTKLLNNTMPSAPRARLYAACYQLRSDRGPVRRCWPKTTLTTNLRRDGLIITKTAGDPLREYSDGLASNYNTKGRVSLHASPAVLVFGLFGAVMARATLNMPDG